MPYNPKSRENLKHFTKGDPKINRKGSPDVPKTIKAFIRTLENIDDEIIIPFEACKTIKKDGKKYIKIIGSNGLKMAMNAYNKAMKGDIRFLDWLTKMGYAGGYEATKNENINLNFELPAQIIIEEDGKN